MRKINKQDTLLETECLNMLLEGIGWNILTKNTARTKKDLQMSTHQTHLDSKPFVKYI